METSFTTIYAQPTDTDFSLEERVEQDLQQQGYVIGSMCRGEPRGFVMQTDANLYIAKWRNIPASQRKLLDGYIVAIGENPRKPEAIQIHYYKK